MNDEDKRICERALQKWGRDAQLWMVVEECAELIKAVAKFENRGPSPVINTVAEAAAKAEERDKLVRSLIEEAVDVEWMLKQLEIMEGTELDWSVARQAAKADLKFLLGMEETT